MGQGKRCSTSLFIISWAGEQFVANNAFTWARCWCRSIPRPCPCRASLSHPAPHLHATALPRLSQLLLTLINLIRIIDQVVCSKREVNTFPRIRQSCGCHAEGAAGAVLQRNEFPLTSCLNFSLFLPRLTQPEPGRLTLINCAVITFWLCCWEVMSFRGIRSLAADSSFGEITHRREVGTVGLQLGFWAWYRPLKVLFKPFFPLQSAPSSPRTFSRAALGAQTPLYCLSMS